MLKPLFVHSYCNTEIFNYYPTPGGEESVPQTASVLGLKLNCVRTGSGPLHTLARKHELRLFPRVSEYTYLL